MTRKIRYISWFVAVIFFTSPIFGISQTKYTPTYFEIFGMISEYDTDFGSSTRGAQKDFVEGFFSNEKNQSRYFFRLMKTYESEIQTDFKITLCSIDAYCSPMLAKQINSHYQLVDRTIKLNKSFILDADEDCRLHYLAGAYRRFGKDGKISMANSFPKIEILALLLKSVGCSDIKIYEQKGLPTAHILEFEANQKTKNLIQQITESADVCVNTESCKLLKIIN